MPSTIALINRLSKSYPELSFKKSEVLSWSHVDKTIYYSDGAQDYLILHELAHALLGHANYTRDIELIAIERSAWDKARDLAAIYGVTITDELIQLNLDTYRDWLHARSTCPQCDAVGFQTKTDTYECPECHHKWRVNEAKNCALRRYSR